MATAHEMHDNARGGDDTLISGRNRDATPCLTTPAAATTR